ncbi:MAG: AAA family ATPase [Treponema sp.]|jgi:predicted ATP-dependent endonuclease of OLD family|nr:AAA family ATPase [Treponema sp.]
MYLKRLKLKNYRLFSDVEVTFQNGMNVLIGKNSTGKSTVLEAVDFLLSNNNANIPAEDIIPYGKRNDKNVQVRIEGSFEMSNIDKENICSILNNENEREQIKKSQLEIIYTKIINKNEKTVRVISNIMANGNGISRNHNLLSIVVNSLYPRLQTANVLKITDQEKDNSILPLRPLNELRQLAPHNSSFLNQYLCNMLYDIKQRNTDEFNNIKNIIIKAYSEMSDMDIEYDPKRAQVQIYFKKSDNGIKIPLESEGWGIREFFYLLLALHNFSDTIILKDEALTHMHKSLLGDFITAIDGLEYQMITTSHIKELIKTLDFSNIIICRKHDSNATVKNLMQSQEIDKLLDELGYPIEAASDIEPLIQG